MDTFTPGPIYPKQTESTPSGLKTKTIGLAVLILLFLVVGFIYLFIIKNKEPEKETAQEISSVATQTNDWKTYKNESFGYELKYPPDWNLEYGIISSPDQKARFNVVTKTCESYQSLGEFVYETHGISTSAIKDVCNSGMSVRLEAYGDKKELPEYEKILDQILSTMKLAVDTSGWKTYTNKDLLFEFKYPEGFRLKMGIDNYSLVHISLEMFEPYPNESDISQTKDRWSPTNFVISAQKTNETIGSIKNYVQYQDSKAAEFQGEDALLVAAGDFCDKMFVFIKNGVRYEITEPTSCSVPLDKRITGIFESFRVVDLDVELKSSVLNGKTYRSEERGFQFNYPNDWLIQEGPITIDTISRPNVILVRFAPKGNTSKSKKSCPEYQTEGHVECKVLKIDSAPGISVYAYFDSPFIGIPGNRLLQGSRSYFDDYVDFNDKDGNNITIDFMSTLKQEEVEKLIKAVLTTFKFTK